MNHTQARILTRADRDGVTTLTLNRGDKFNALSVELLTALQEELDAIAADTSVRVVVVAGAGKAFCAGHDLKQMRADPREETIRALFEQCARVMTTLTRMPQPVIARVHGVATAAGCQLVAMCDLAVASDRACFATSGITVGLMCSTPMVAVTRNLPRKQAMEMLLTGDFIDADTALRYGLVNRVVTPDALDDAVDEMARAIAGRAPVSIAMGKQLFYRQLEEGLEAAYALAADIMTCNMMEEDTQAGIDAFVAKEHMPIWKDRPARTDEGKK